MSRVLALVIITLLATACARADAFDEQIRLAHRTVERFHELYNADIGSVVGELMALNDTGTIEWSGYMSTQREQFGRMRRARPIGSELVPAGTNTTVELRYATTFDAGDARELFVVRIEGDRAKLAFYARWWP